MGKQTIRVRRVGSVTFGVVLVVTGSLYLLQRFWPEIAYSTIFQFWPLILILLGIEVLLGSRNQNVSVLDEEGRIVEQSKVVYDVTAILLMVVMMVFAMCMAVLDLGWTNYCNLW